MKTFKITNRNGVFGKNRRPRFVFCDGVMYRGVLLKGEEIRIAENYAANHNLINNDDPIWRQWEADVVLAEAFRRRLMR